MIGGMPRCMLPHLTRVPHLHVKRPLEKTFAETERANKTTVYDSVMQMQEEVIFVSCLYQQARRLNSLVVAVLWGKEHLDEHPSLLNRHFFLL